MKVLGDGWGSGARFAGGGVPSPRSSRLVGANPPPPKPKWSGRLISAAFISKLRALGG